MKFSTAAIPFALSLLCSLVRATIVSYDEAYDVASASLTTVACSDGPNGMLTRNFTTFGSLPKFPYIGGFVGVAGWNSPNCGSCHQLTFTNVTSGAKKSINILVIDSTDVGYNVALAAMNELTGGRAKALGRLNVTDISVNRSVCGLKCK
jgi:hypothetical protein